MQRANSCAPEEKPVGSGKMGKSRRLTGGGESLPLVSRFLSPISEGIANNTPMSEPLKKVTITTDGGCDPNPGVGAWAAILRCGNASRVVSGIDMASTNNRMELTAVIEALSTLKKPCAVTLRTDSMICIWAIEAAHIPKKRAKYEKKGKNMDLVRRLWDVAQVHQVKTVWVKGHSGDRDNEACDQICANAIKTATPATA